MEQPTPLRQTLKNHVQSKPDLIIRSLQDFYNQPGRIDEIIPILTSTSPISLRLIDWFVTNYSKKYNITYIFEGRQFMVHFHYKRELKSYTKRLFDPFCRRERISFQIRGKAPLEETTVGQLNFFRWAIGKGVIQFILEHVLDIEKDMNESYKEHYGKEKDTLAPQGRRKRKEMSKSAMKTVNFHSMPVTVTFD